mmetsp:Transcript_8777/g.13007  ORF Transcript_8777/g.13007 Transcript_8777/m.13007 type:complete len:250 (+) Transcript_8777:48-797(+)
MFITTLLKDVVYMDPGNMDMEHYENSIEDYLREKYVGKVLKNVGLCIAIWNVSKITRPLILPNDGRSYSTVHVEVVVLHPQVNEIMVGTIDRVTPSGIYVSLTGKEPHRLAERRKFLSDSMNDNEDEVDIQKDDSKEEEDKKKPDPCKPIFSDIFIPRHLMPSDFTWQPQQGLWAWEIDQGKLWLEVGEPIRFRVQSVTFPSTQEQHDDPPKFVNPYLQNSVKPDEKLPMLIQGSLLDEGSGSLSWWVE